MTDAQARILVALRQSPVAMTQTELAKAVDASARDIREYCAALMAQGQIKHAHGFYTLVQRR